MKKDKLVEIVEEAIKLEKSELEKVDPHTKLRGTMLDKAGPEEIKAPKMPKLAAPAMPKMDMKKGIPANMGSSNPNLMMSEGLKKICSHLKKCSMKKALTAGEKGVHSELEQKGVSSMGNKARGMSFHEDPKGNRINLSSESAKVESKDKLKELKDMPKPNLPKSEDLDKASLSVPLGPKGSGAGSISGINIGSVGAPKKKKDGVTGMVSTNISSSSGATPAAAKSEDLDKAKIMDFKTGKMLADLGQPEHLTPPAGKLAIAPKDDKPITEVHEVKPAVSNMKRLAEMLRSKKK